MAHRRLPERIDLNLLVALDALLRERSVSAAAARVGVGQPAMSAALSRVRALFDDPMLVRTPRGMEPTPRALEVAGPLREAELPFATEPWRMMAVWPRRGDADPGLRGCWMGFGRPRASPAAAARPTRGCLG